MARKAFVVSHAMREKVRHLAPNPALVDENGVLICGHCRTAAAAKLKQTSIPVIVARGWSEEEKQAYRLADNELAARASWDFDLLGSELCDLRSSGFDLDLIGFGLPKGLLLGNSQTVVCVRSPVQWLVLPSRTAYQQHSCFQ